MRNKNVVVGLVRYDLDIDEKGKAPRNQGGFVWMTSVSEAILPFAGNVNKPSILLRSERFLGMKPEHKARTQLAITGVINDYSYMLRDHLNSNKKIKICLHN